VTTPSWIELDGVVNMRDVGGLPTTDGGTIAPRRLLRSDNLQELSDADVDHLVQVVGVTDIVDLRSNVEVQLEGPGPLQVRDLASHHRYSLLPEAEEEVSARDALLLAQEEATGKRPEPVRHDDDFWASHYLGFLADRPDSVLGALSVIADASGATIVHCAAGKDRTGTVVGLALSVAGVSDEDVVADYVATGERIDRIVDRLMKRPAYADALREQPRDHHVPRPETMHRILTVLRKRHGGAEGWLVDNGWSEDQVAQLRGHLRA
jgi:protein tyrosine/serine phosphatase